MATLTAMDPRRLAVIGLAGAAAIGAGYFINHSLRAHDTVPVAALPAAPSVEVLVARNAIVPGHRIASGDVEWQAWPSQGNTSTFVRKSPSTDNMARVVGTVATSSFAVGEPITEGKLANDQKNGFMASLLPPGMEAVSVPLTPETAVNGFILPNNRVDVIITRALEGNGGFVSETVVSGARVVAVDDKAETPPNTQGVPGAKVATLAVTPAQAVAISTAKRMGTLSLTLASATGGDHACEGDGGSMRQVTVMRFGLTKGVQVLRNPNC